MGPFVCISVREDKDLSGAGAPLSWARNQAVNQEMSPSMLDAFVSVSLLLRKKPLSRCQSHRY